jgi:hypothetical protein
MSHMHQHLHLILPHSYPTHKTHEMCGVALATFSLVMRRGKSDECEMCVGSGRLILIG